VFLRERLSRWLLRVARSRIGGRLSAVVCMFAPWSLPVRHVIRTRRVIAFYHPRPEADDHVVFVPRTYIPSLASLVQQRDARTFLDLVTVAAMYAEEKNRASAILAINVGGRQEVLQLHGHLLSTAGLRTAIDEIIDEHVVDIHDATAVLDALHRLVERIENAGEAWGGSVLVRNLGSHLMRIAATVSTVENRGPLLR